MDRRVYPNLRRRAELDKNRAETSAFRFGNTEADFAKPSKPESAAEGSIAEFAKLAGNDEG